MQEAETFVVKDNYFHEFMLPLSFPVVIRKVVDFSRPSPISGDKVSSRGHLPLSSITLKEIISHFSKQFSDLYNLQSRALNLFGFCDSLYSIFSENSDRTLRQRLY